MTRGSDSLPWRGHYGRPMRKNRRRRVVTMGRNDLGVDLLVNEKRLRSHLSMAQKRVGEWFLGEEVARLLRATEVNLVLDVGANVGQFAQGLRQSGYRGRIASFEPVAEPFARLRAAADGDELWSTYPYALGAEDGAAEINRVPGTMSSMLPASEFGKQWSGRLQQQTTATIQVRRLESVFDEVTSGLDPVRAYLKMDTQGFDLQVFEGASATLDGVVAMQSEASCVPIYDGMPRLPEQWAVYEDAGFEAVGVYPVTRDQRTLRAIEFDLVMVRPSEVRDPKA
jgi:FkbM family methyltransferase